MKRVLIVLLLTAISSKAQSEKLSDVWKFDVGPFVAVPIRGFNMTQTFGVGVDASATRSITKVPGLSAGGRVYYGHFFPKSTDLFFTESQHANLVGIVAEGNYLYKEKYIVGLDLGLGLRFPSFFGSTGFARGGYVGYRIPFNERTMTFSFVYMNRTTFATQFLGLRASISL